MSPEPLPWLPAAPRADLDTVMRLVVEQWLADWIMRPVGVDVMTSERSGNGSGDWRGGCGAWLQGGLGDAVALGLAACDGQADSLNPLDRALLGRVGDEMLEDLLARLRAGPERSAAPARAHSALDGAGPDDAQHRFRVGASSGEWALMLALDEILVIRLRKAIAGSSRTFALVPLSAALAGEEVGLGCHLGSAQITVADLSALAAGDVLVLDRRLDVPVPLTIDGNLPRTGQARIGGEAGALEVTLIETIDLMQGI